MLAEIVHRLDAAALQALDMALRKPSLGEVLFGSAARQNRPALTAGTRPEASPPDSQWRGFPPMGVRESRNPRASPGGHLEPADFTLAGAAERELAEATGIDPGMVACVLQAPVYVEYGRGPARPEKDEPDHFHLDFGYAFATAGGDVGRIQESEVTGAGWYPLAVAERLAGHRIGRAVCAPAPDGLTGPC